jgi:hypothetical protein
MFQQPRNEAQKANAGVRAIEGAGIEEVEVAPLPRKKKFVSIIDSKID